MKYLVTLIFLFIFSVNAYAEDKKIERIPAEEMLYAMGFDEILAQAKETQKHEVGKQVDVVMQQLSGALDTLPEEKVNKVKNIFDEMISSIVDSWSTEEAIKIYAKPWSENYTDAELKEIIEELKTDKAKKQIRIAIEANKYLSEYIQERYNKKTEKMFLISLQKISEVIREE